MARRGETDYGVAERDSGAGDHAGELLPDLGLCLEKPDFKELED